MHRSLWPEERNETMKSVGLHACSSPYEFEHELTSSHVSFENACFGVSESKEAEIRHLGRPRGTHMERFSPQYTSQKSAYNEKRKQRCVIDFISRYVLQTVIELFAIYF